MEDKSRHPCLGDGGDALEHSEPGTKRQGGMWHPLLPTATGAARKSCGSDITWYLTPSAARRSDGEGFLPGSAGFFPNGSRGSFDFFEVGTLGWISLGKLSWS